MPKPVLSVHGVMGELSKSLTRQFQTMRSRASARFRRDSHANFSIGPALGVAGAIVGAVVVVLVAAAFIPTFFSATSDTVTAFEDPNTTTGNDSADALLPVFAILVGITALFGIGGLIVGAIALKKKGT